MFYQLHWVNCGVFHLTWTVCKVETPRGFHVAFNRFLWKLNGVVYIKQTIKDSTNCFISRTTNVDGSPPSFSAPSEPQIMNFIFLYPAVVLFLHCLHLRSAAWNKKWEENLQRKLLNIRISSFVQTPKFNSMRNVKIWKFLIFLFYLSPLEDEL